MIYDNLPNFNSKKVYNLDEEAVMEHKKEYEQVNYIFMLDKEKTFKVLLLKEYTGHNGIININFDIDRDTDTYKELIPKFNKKSFPNYWAIP